MVSDSFGSEPQFLGTLRRVLYTGGLCSSKRGILGFSLEDGVNNLSV